VNEFEEYVSNLKEQTVIIICIGDKDFRKTFPELVEWYDTLVVDQSIPNVQINDGRLTHYEAGEYISDIKN
jgi:hypothetical protein